MQTAVDLALLEMAANGTALDAGQASLVRQMCTSGTRLQCGGGGGGVVAGEDLLQGLGYDLSPSNPVPRPAASDSHSRILR
jgi:hypothetical protein